MINTGIEVRDFTSLRKKLREIPLFKCAENSDFSVKDRNTRTALVVGDGGSWGGMRLWEWGSRVLYQNHLNILLVMCTNLHYNPSKTA